MWLTTWFPAQTPNYKNIVSPILPSSAPQDTHAPTKCRSIKTVMLSHTQTDALSDECRRASLCSLTWTHACMHTDTWMHAHTDTLAHIHIDTLAHAHTDTLPMFSESHSPVYMATLAHMAHVLVDTLTHIHTSTLTHAHMETLAQTHPQWTQWQTCLCTREYTCPCILGHTGIHMHTHSLAGSLTHISQLLVPSRVQPALWLYEGAGAQCFL